MIYQIFVQNNTGYFSLIEIEGNITIDEKTGQSIIKNDALEILAIVPTNMLITLKQNIE
jgi:hypothetical protein